MDTPRTPTPRKALSLMLALAGVAAGPALAQTIEDPPEEIEQAERELPRVRPQADAIAPTPAATTSPPKPGLTGGQQWLDAEAGRITPPARLPEGYVVVERPGRVLSAPSGHRVFVIDKDVRNPGEGPMLLLPNRTLSRMDASLLGAPGVGVVVSGLVYDYAGRNYLLATNFRLMTLRTPEQAASEPEQAAAAVNPAKTPPANASASDDPEIAELFAELDDARSGAPNIVPPPPAPVRDNLLERGQAASADIGLIPDGTPITRRRGRLVRLGGGAWAIRFDNDLDLGSDEPDRPLTVLPCGLLERMEKVALDEGDGVELLVSGRVYTYGERRYLLPTIYQRPLTIGIDPMQ